MINYEIISFIREEMLKDPSIEAELAWRSSKMAEEDSTAYELMVEWMKTTKSSFKKEIEQDLDKLYRNFLNGTARTK